LGEAMTDAEVLAECNRLGVGAPLPLKLACWEIAKSRDIEAEFMSGRAYSADEVRDRYREARKRANFWLAHWRGEDSSPYAPDIDVNAQDDLDSVTLPFGKILAAIYFFAAAMIFVAQAIAVPNVAPALMAARSAVWPIWMATGWPHGVRQPIPWKGE
jgi:hypothetical protein